MNFSQIIVILERGGELGRESGLYVAAFFEGMLVDARLGRSCMSRLLQLSESCDE